MSAAHSAPPARPFNRGAGGRTHPARLSREPGRAHSAFSGQALVELAVFGSLLLVLIGYLVNNVLTSDYQQQSKAEAFRRGLAAAAATTDDVSPTAPTAISTLLVQDRHIPNPSDPFAIGSVAPMIGQAGVTRKYNLQNVPVLPQDLPRLAIQIENATGCPGTLVPPDFRGGMRTCYYTTAGFRDELDVPQESLGRYRFIYGGGNVCDKADCGGGNIVCVEVSPDPVIDDSGMETYPCIRYAKHIRIIDSCAGEIINYDECKAQARKITDGAACAAACAKAAIPDCATMCGQPMQVPPYAAPGALDAMFGGAGLAAMGLQPGGVQIVTQNNQLNKQEDAAGVTTTSDVDLTEATTRSIARVGGTDTIQSQRIEQTSTTWSTTW